tara:strand:- start:20 stop:694 length:675 start_codon:yes stop_codon:yes gene_type:complete
MKFKLFILLIFLSVVLSETLKYDLEFSGIPAGESILSLKKESVEENSIYNLTSITKTNKVFSKIIKFTENITIALDTFDFSIKKIQKKTSQGRKRKSFKATINYDAFTDTSTAMSNNKIMKIEGKVYNPFSIIYYLRNQNIELSDAFNFTTYDNDKKKDVTIIATRIEDIKVPHGKYSCIVVEPHGKLSKGSIRIWLDQETKIPIQIEIKNRFGTLKMSLKNIN